MNAIQQTISQIRKGLTLYIVFSLVASIITAISLVTAMISGVAAVATGSASLGAMAIVMMIIPTVLYVLVIFGLYVYYGGLKGFATHLDEVGAKAVNNLALGAMFMIIATLCSVVAIYVPLIFSIIAVLVSIAAFVFNILGYSALGKSTSLNELGKAGAKQLFNGFIMAIIAAVVVFIPVLGGIAALVLNILYWVYLFKGWAKVRDSFGQ